MSEKKFASRQTQVVTIPGIGDRETGNRKPKCHLCFYKLDVGQ